MTFFSSLVSRKSLLAEIYLPPKIRYLHIKPLRGVPQKDYEKVFKDWIKYLKIYVSVKGWYFDNWNKQKCNPTFSCHLTSIIALLLIPPSYLHNYQVLKLVTHMNVAIFFLSYIYSYFKPWTRGLVVCVLGYKITWNDSQLGTLIMLGTLRFFSMLYFVLFNFWAFLCWITLFW